MDLLVVGDVNADLVLRGGDIVPTFGQREQLVDHAELVLGGSGGIFAAGAARLGLEVAMVACVGDDALGRVMIEALRAGRRGRQRGRHGRPTRRPASASPSPAPDDRAILTAAGALGRLRAEDVPDELLDARAARARGLAVPAGRPRARAARAGRPRALELARHRLGPARGLGRAARRVRRAAAERRGGAAPGRPHRRRRRGGGARARRPAGRWSWSSSAPRARWPPTAARSRARRRRGRAVDSTGAGDSFDAGFLAARLDGADLDRRARAGMRVRRAEHARAGGTAAQPTLAEARALAMIVFVAGSPSIDRTHEVEALGRARSTGPPASSPSPAARRSTRRAPRTASAAR